MQWSYGHQERLILQGMSHSRRGTIQVDTSFVLCWGTTSFASLMAEHLEGCFITSGRHGAQDLWI